MINHLLHLLTVIHLTVGDFSFICPSRPHWNLRAQSKCDRIEEYRCLWDNNNHKFVEQCEGYDIQIKGFRKIIEGDITAGDCTANRYQPRMWTTKGNYDCKFQKSLCNEIGQTVYDDGSSTTDRRCGCYHGGGYVFLHKPRHMCYCVPSEEDCTCIKKTCPDGYVVDPEYECRSLKNWKLSFRCKEISHRGSAAVSPSTILNIKEGRAFSTKTMGVRAVPISTIFLCICICVGAIVYTCIKKEETIDHQLQVPEQRKIILLDWITEDKMFVPTQAAAEVMTKIKEHNFVVVTGNSGTGKTFTVRHTALVIEQEGYIIVPAEDPRDFKDYYKPGCKTVFVFDDLCGRFTLNQTHLDNWKLYIQLLETILRDNCCKVLASCRLQIFNDIKMKDFISEIKGREVEISLTNKENKRMVKKYFNNKKSDVDDKKLSEIDFLPFLCSNFRNRGISEFKKSLEKPFDFFGNEFEKLYRENDDGKRKYCAIVLCVLYNNTLTWDELNKEPEIFRLLLRECELSPNESAKRMKTSLESLIGVYITYKNGKYKIIHDKLFDFAAKYFGGKMLGLFIRFAHESFVKERFVVGTSNTADVIEISDDQIEIFMNRLVSDWNKGNVNKVFNNTNMASEQFRQGFLSYLIKECDESLQRELVQKRDNTNGDTSLYKICFKGDTEFARWMLNVGADVNLGRNNNSSPLQIACRERYTDLVKLLLGCKHIDVNLSDNSGRTALHWACKEGYTDLVKLLLRWEKIDVNLSDNSGRTALQWACKEGYTDIVRLLLGWENIDVNLSDNSGRTALQWACYKGYTDLVKLLLDCKQSNVNLSDSNGMTALLRACSQGNIDVVKLLLQCGDIDVNLVDITGLSALHFACRKRNTNLVKLLLECGQINANLGDKKGITALHFACLEKNTDLVELLLQSGKIDVNQSADDGDTPLYVACKNDNVAIVTELLKCEQIDINHSDNNGHIAVYLARYFTQKEIDKILRTRDFDVNISAINNSSHVECDHDNNEKLEQFLHD